MKSVKLCSYEVFEDGTIISYKNKEPKKIKYTKELDVYINRKKYRISYSKLVYVAFNRRFDLFDLSYHIEHKDNNITNNNINNLYATKDKKHLRGENNSKSKLTDEQIIEIRRLYKKGEIGYRVIGKMYNVSHTLIKNIIEKKTRGELV